MLLRSHTIIQPFFKATIARYISTKVAIVGSGPAGFYTAQKLLKQPDINVDIYEKLPVPFGLIRYGVAPDHPEVKNVINSFTSLADSVRVNFYGNVSIGKDLQLDDLLEAYHAVVLCYGSGQDRLLNIEGENTNNTISARSFVGWYNGVPEDKDLKINLDCDTACIIGQGNVALDCARILMKPANLDKTDITSYAQQRIVSSNIKRVYIIGRRGPIQAAFTIKEFRELLQMTRNRSKLEPKDIFKQYGVTLEQLMALSRQRRRLTELMLSSCLGSDLEMNKDESSQLIFKFLSKPYKIVGNEAGNVCRLALQQTRYNSCEEFIDEKAHPEELDTYESIDCGLVIRSIGYKSVGIDQNIPMNHRVGCVMNTLGRVHGYKHLYCSGWLATGASGVIAGTLHSSEVTAKSILQDLENQRLFNKKGYEKIAKLLKQPVVHFNDWLRIDELERRLGETLGKSREKLVDIDKMLEIAHEKL